MRSTTKQSGPASVAAAQALVAAAAGLLMTCLLSSAAPASERRPSGWIVHYPADIGALSDTLWDDAPADQAGMEFGPAMRAPASFRDAFGLSWELVSDPGASHGSAPALFEPPPEAWIRETLQAAEQAVGSIIHCELFVLPAPRRAMPRSSCDGVGIYLSPPRGRPFTRMEFEAVLFHEIGHAVERQCMPDRGGALWQRYRKLRGIEDARFRFDGPHGNRPQEIFAEDFRHFFGTPLAREAIAIEQCDAPARETCPGLLVFFRELVEQAARRRGTG